MTAMPAVAVLYLQHGYLNLTLSRYGIVWKRKPCDYVVSSVCLPWGELSTANGLAISIFHGYGVMYSSSAAIVVVGEDPRVLRWCRRVIATYFQ